MRPDCLIVEKVRKVILGHASEYFKHEFGLGLEVSLPTCGSVQTMVLRDITAIVALGGVLNLMVAFSFERSMAHALSETAMFGIRVAEDERESMVRDTAAEALNIVVGQSTADLTEGEEVVTLSPPVVITNARSIPRPKEAVFLNIALSTVKGVLDIWLVQPVNLFDESLRVR